MSEIGEEVATSGPPPPPPQYLQASILEIWFKSGIDLYEVDSNAAVSQVPPSGRPHWGDPATYPAVYVREGGAGETKELQVMVQWAQQGCDGSAKLTGRLADGSIEIEGTFSISGAQGQQLVDCTFKKKPSVVKNHGINCQIQWGLEAGGSSHPSTTTSLKLFFLDAKPTPIGWPSRSLYRNHFVRAVDWATQWADGKQGAAAVFQAIWAKFAGPQNPHDTGFAYWQTDSCAQTLIDVVRPGFAATNGWSCRGIAHLFMECLALHAIQCSEVVPNKHPMTEMFLVKNWRFTAAPQNPSLSGSYYGGSWERISSPPLNRQVQSVTSNFQGLTVDCKKVPGVPAQGQLLAPLGFSNHWIVKTQGMLHDTSYGGVHPDDFAVYATNSIDGWLLASDPDRFSDPILGERPCRAWSTQPLPGSPYALVRRDGSSN